MDRCGGSQGRPRRGRRTPLPPATADTRRSACSALIAIWAGARHLRRIWIGVRRPLRRVVPHPAQPLEPVGADASIAIMATGMVLIIVMRQIDLSVGSIWLHRLRCHGPQVTSSVRARARLTGPIPGSSPLPYLARWSACSTAWLIAYLQIPFIVTLGGLMVWRGAACRLARRDGRADGHAFQPDRRTDRWLDRRHGQLGRRGDRLRRHLVAIYALASAAASSSCGLSGRLPGAVRLGRALIPGRQLLSVGAQAVSTTPRQLHRPRRGPVRPPRPTASPLAEGRPGHPDRHGDPRC